MNKGYDKILVVNTFGIGDLLFSTPLLKTLRSNFPTAKIDYMCNARTQCLLRNNKNINNVIVFEKDEFRSALKNSGIEFGKKIIGFMKEIKRNRYNLVVDLSLGHQISLLLKTAGIKKRIGFNYRGRGRFLTDKLDIPGFYDRHVVEHYLDILALVGIKTFDDKNLEVTLSGELERWSQDFLSENNLLTKELIGLAPGGGKSWGNNAVYRRWDPANFARVALKLLGKRSRAFFLIFGSQEESNICKPIETALGGNVINLCGRLELPRSIALIKRCNLILCNDGGILHIAVSQKVKTVSIFGPVDSNVYGPYPPSDRDKVVTADGVNCRPCYRNFKHKACETHDCLKKIDSDKVLKIVEDGLSLR
ncbi:MAG: hypothetical protein A2987_06570 [Omnitrophica bacterium RIFCSPLOWO2_01_FULL_45_10]|nr:MAG: hypothetical protein A2987_06570 [Omnitrophica bacterium RIFCSPLOWO2_01_FULL_45_10]